jgi:hypothetical protein
MAKCTRCRLKSACKHIKGPFCPWLFYIALAAAIAVPGYLLWKGSMMLNLG